jgi:hypothetical protein
VGTVTAGHVGAEFESDRSRDKGTRLKAPGFHEPFDGMGYMDEVVEELPARTTA